MENGNAAEQNHSPGGSERLKGLGGIISGFAYTYSKALKASRAEVIDALDGEDAVETLVTINGHRGTDYAGSSTNRIRSDDHPGCEGIDKVFIALTPDQFEALAARVGAQSGDDRPSSEGR